MTSNWQSRQKKDGQQDTKTINRLVDKRADFSVLEEGDTEATFQAGYFHISQNNLINVLIQIESWCFWV